MKNIFILLAVCSMNAAAQKGILGAQPSTEYSLLRIEGAVANTNFISQPSHADEQGNYATLFSGQYSDSSSFKWLSTSFHYSTSYKPTVGNGQWSLTGGNVLSSWLATGRQTDTTSSFDSLVWANYNLKEHSNDAAILDSLITYTGYTNRSEIFYKGKEVSGFEFSDHELFNDSGYRLPITTLRASNTLSSWLSAAEGNGVYISHQAVYQEDWKGADQSLWASLIAPSTDQGTSLTLYSTANRVGMSGSGAFVINTGSNNDFSIGAAAAEGFIGWSNKGGKIVFSASEIETGAPIHTTTSITVSQGDLDRPLLSNSIQAYFGSSANSATGILIDNTSLGTEARSGITIRQNNVANWIGTYGMDSSSSLYLPGSLVLRSQGAGGILFAAVSDAKGLDGQIRFAVNESEIARFTNTSFLLGTVEEEPSAVLTIESISRGLLLSRMTSIQRKSIKYPKAGLIVFDTTLHKLVVYNSNKWEVLCSQEID